MTYKVDHNTKIHCLQGAVWKLESVADILVTVNGANDPSLPKVQTLIDTLNAQIDQCWEENG